MRYARLAVTLVLTVAVAMLATLAAVPPLLAQVAAQVPDSLTAALPHVAPMVGGSVLAFGAIGSGLYQLAKKSITVLDKLPGPLHAGIVIAASYIYQAFAPTLSHAIGYELPGDLSQVGPLAIAGMVSALVVMAFHPLWSRVSKWLQARVAF